jgi:predicted RNA-binding Zn ribbon-like protein
MAPLTASYEYHDDGSVSAIFEGRVIAKTADFASAESTATEYLDGLQKKRVKEDATETEKKATHITTPNGLKGQIISRVDGMWGNEITVRFANNEIRRFETTANLTFSAEAEDAPSSYAVALQSVLDRPVDSSRAGLTARVKELEAVQHEVHSHFASERNAATQRDLNRIAMTASVEVEEVKEALAYLAAVDAENASPAAPVYAAVEQVSLGQNSGNDWLSITAQDMIDESEEEDLEELMDEGPTKLVSSLEDSAIHHAGTVQEIAAAHIMGRTAGFQGAQVEAYREQFVARTEQARRLEMTYRQDAAREVATVKQASMDNVPDEALFS